MTRNLLRHPSLLFGLCAAMLLLAGCGKRLKPVYPVKGQVVAGAEKKPATGALLFFHPVKKVGDDGEKPMAEVDKEGRFALTTRMSNDGAPAGEYIITIIWPPSRKSIFQPEEDDQLGGAYGDPKTSKLRYTVHAGPTNEVPVIELP